MESGVYELLCTDCIPVRVHISSKALIVLIGGWSNVVIVFYLATSYVPSSVNYSYKSTTTDSIC